MSEVPVKGPFVPLGDFIKAVGPPPPDISLVTYLQRLREQGWDVNRTERKLLMCGKHMGGNTGAGNRGSKNGICVSLLPPPHSLHRLLSYGIRHH